MDTGRRTVPLPEKHLGPRVRGGDRSVSGDAHGVCWVGGETYGFRPTGSSRREPLRQTRKIGNRKSCVSLPSPAPHRRLPRRRCGPAPLRTHRLVLALRSTVPCLGAQVATAKMNLSDEGGVRLAPRQAQRRRDPGPPPAPRTSARALARTHAQSGPLARRGGWGSPECFTADCFRPPALPLSLRGKRPTDFCVCAHGACARSRARAHTRAGDLPRSRDASGAEEPVRRFTPCMLCIAHVMPPVT